MTDEINAAIRAAAGRERVDSGSEAEPPSRGLGGGARRQPMKPGPPSMDSLIRAEVMARREFVYDGASQLDRVRRDRREMG
jgi:hypothetical protein